MERSLNSELLIPFGYAEQSPPADLAPWLECLWTSRRDPAERPSAQHVLPDGCADVIFVFDRGVSATAVGPMTKPLIVSGAGPELYVGARFHPGCALKALHTPASALLDTTIELDLSHDRTIGERLGAPLGMTMREKIALAVAFVRERMRRANEAPACVRAAVGRITLARGNLRVAALSSEIGVTRQQLARQFAMHVGVTPKLFARVMRTQALMAQVNAQRALREPIDWSSLAYDLGYYDQSHLIDDFKSLTGWTPGEWSAISPAFLSPASTP